MTTIYVARRGDDYDGNGVWVCSYKNPIAEGVSNNRRAYHKPHIANIMAWAWQIISREDPAPWSLHKTEERGLMLTNLGDMREAYLLLADKMSPITAHGTLRAYMQMMET